MSKGRLYKNRMVAEHLLNTSNAPRSVPNSCPLTKSTNLIISEYDWWIFTVVAKLYSFLTGNFQDQCTKPHKSRHKESKNQSLIGISVATKTTSSTRQQGLKKKQPLSFKFIPYLVCVMYPHLPHCTCRGQRTCGSLFSLHLCSEDQIHVSGLVIDVLSHLASLIVYS